jgi:hypothetical protein
VHLNKWDATRDVLLVAKRVEWLSQLQRTPRTYQKRSAQYWEHDLMEKRTKQKRRMDDERQVNTNVNDSNVPNAENMSPTELREGLRGLGVKTRVQNVKRLQEMFNIALKNPSEAE